MDFTYTIDRQELSARAALTGRLIDKSQAIELTEEIRNLLEEGVMNVTLDLSALEYLNSSGLNVLINLLTLVRNKGGELSITSLNERVKQLFLITKLNAVFNIVPAPVG